MYRSKVHLSSVEGSKLRDRDYFGQWQIEGSGGSSKNPGEMPQWVRVPHRHKGLSLDPSAHIKAGIAVYVSNPR